MADPLEKLSCENLSFVEQLLGGSGTDAGQLPPAWQAWLTEVGIPAFGLSAHSANGSSANHRPETNGHAGAGHDVSVALRQPSAGNVFYPASARVATSGNGQATGRFSLLQQQINHLIRAYRSRGHLAAELDPLGRERMVPDELLPSHHGLSDADLRKRCGALAEHGEANWTVAELIERLESTYCRHIGVQFMHIDEPRVRNWLQERMESSGNRITLSRQTQLRILTWLTDASIFEEFVRKKYVGAKTFSLEGSESLIPLLKLAIEKASGQGVREVVLAMAHRGRLNVLANIIGKAPSEIFREFNDPFQEQFRGRGDVSYHLGYSGDWTTSTGEPVHLSLCFNPSHLEFVNPVALGRMRAKQDHTGDDARTRGLTLLMHGDAAFAGEGVVQESLNLSQLSHYATGGTLHVVINNQIGFTTPPAESRSTRYATDIARLLQVPIFHVNGEHPEAVAQVVDVALDFRAEFQRDVVIDMYGYRRLGHNEGDEPRFTQPLMYEAIDHGASVRENYLEHLLQLEGITRDEAEDIAEERTEKLAADFERAREETYQPQEAILQGVWQGYQGGPEPDDDPDTGLPQETLSSTLHQLTEVPEGFHLHPKLQRGMEDRRRMATGEKRLDWAAAEALAIASIAAAGHPVRFSGQDTARGTFSQRHAVLHDIEDGHTYQIFQHLNGNSDSGASQPAAPVEIFNSPLCETAALGFEYGYSLDSPASLVIWEAQFGDFVNAAQVIIDQFLASAEDKWRRLSGLVMLLPHAFEGMGPEHSSARLERFLALAAEDNMQIAMPTTPAQYFHLLRRQVIRPWRKPLVIFTPKSLLRLPAATSALAGLASGHFQRIIPDDSARGFKRLIFCSGKIYYDLLEYREEQQRNDVGLVRVEQFYPLRDKHWQQALASASSKTRVLWVQEEPENMGASRYWRARFGEKLFGHKLHMVTREESASPATGSKASHKREQQELIEQAFNQ